MVFTKNSALINSILLYLVIIFVIIYQKPDFIYDKYDRLKKFGINNDDKSLIPFPIFVVLISIGIYLFFTILSQLFS